MLFVHFKNPFFNLFILILSSFFSPSWSMDNNIENKWIKIVSTTETVLDSWDKGSDRVGHRASHSSNHVDYDHQL